MSVDWDGGSWTCGGAVAAKSFVRSATPVQDDRVSQASQTRKPPEFPKALVALPPNRRPKKAKRLKPDKWGASFDSEGKPVGFQKLLKTIKTGGVDHSIRAEVWEFLLGCYALGTTSQYREQIRNARRERYKDLIEQCRMMHASVGTGSLAYTVGSKVMDVRMLSKDSARREAKLGVRRVSQDAKARIEGLIDGQAARATQQQSEDQRESFDAATNCESPAEGLHPMTCSRVYRMSSPEADNREGLNLGISDTVAVEAECLHLPVSSATIHHNSPPHRQQLGCEDPPSVTGYGHLPGQVVSSEAHEFEVMAGEESGSGLGQAEVNPNIKSSESTESRILNGPAGQVAQDSLEVAQGGLSSQCVPSKVGDLGTHTSNPVNTNASKSNRAADFQNDTGAPTVDAGVGERDGEGQLDDGPVLCKEVEKKKGGFVEMAALDPVLALSADVNEERVADWLWTLHRIVVDVVRTDRHLEFYGDAKNMARMSDILAVYAWIDPSTGYCQGMSDLLSPFIVLFDDDADAFWCFESLLRRVRQNFQMEGPVGVMKQLESLSKIMELTDAQLFKHLLMAGADNFLFAFRMLLVLFRRELSFGEALYMWEMMWAADFDQAMAWALEYNCLDALVLRNSSSSVEDQLLAEDESYLVQSPEPRTAFPASPLDQPHLTTPVTFGRSFLLKRSPFCGLRPGHFWPKHQHRTPPTVTGLLGRNGDEELSVFCVAAILVQNRSKLLKEVQSMDDAIKIFNDMDMKVKVHSCVHTAIKLRKKYHSQPEAGKPLMRFSSGGPQDLDI